MLRSVSALCAAVMLSLGVGLVLPSAATASVEGGTVSVAVVVQRPAPDFKPALGKDKGSGSSDAARSCGQGGYLDRFDATTGTGFRTPGACVAHAASGGVQATITLASTTYSCADDPGATCWGIVVGSGVAASQPRGRPRPGHGMGTREGRRIRLCERPGSDPVHIRSGPELLRRGIHRRNDPHL